VSISGFNGVYQMSDMKVNAHTYWELSGNVDYESRIYWSNYSIFADGYWIISGSGGLQIAAFEDYIGEGYDMTPPLTDTHNWTVYNSSSFDDGMNHPINLAAVRCHPLSGETWSPTSMPTESWHCVEVTIIGVSGFDGEYVMSNVTMNGHFYWNGADDLNSRRQINWVDDSDFNGGYWLIHGEGEMQVAAFDDDTGVGHYSTPPLTGSWNWTIYNSSSFEHGAVHLANLEPVRCAPPPDQTHTPTSTPTTVSPTSMPTEEYRCVEVRIDEVSGFNGVYRLSNNTLNDHKYWDGIGELDSGEKIFWVNNTVFGGGFWIISGSGEMQMAAFDDDTMEGFHSTPPLTGSWNWTIYNSSMFNDGKKYLTTLEVVRCSPPIGQTHSPTPEPSEQTPRPTEEYHCIEVAVPGRPGFAGIYQMSNLELNEHKYWELIGPVDNDRQIYWTDNGIFSGGYWMIRGQGDTLVAAIDDDIGAGYNSTPPLTDSWNWTIYNTDSFNDGVNYLINLEVVRCSPRPGHSWSPTPFPTLKPTEIYRCLEVTTGSIPGFDGIYIMSNMTLSGHKYWELAGDQNYDGRIYWSNYSIFAGGHWVIEGSGEYQIAALDDDTEERYELTPPLTDNWNWTIYNSSTFRDGIQHPINLEVVRCSPPAGQTSSPTPVPTSSHPTHVPTEAYHCVEVIVSGVIGFDGIYVRSNVTLNEHSFWVSADKQDSRRQIYWINDTVFEGGFWLIRGLGELQIAAFEDDIDVGHYLTPPLLGSWNWTVYNSSSFEDGAEHLVNLNPSRCSPPPGQTHSPTPLPTTQFPTSIPTAVYHCIQVNIPGVSGFNGIYKLSNVTLNEHTYWLGTGDLNSQEKIYWINNSVFFGGYWLISGTGHMQLAAFDAKTGAGYESTPPLTDSWNWTVYNSTSFNDGVKFLVTLEVVTCEPPAGQTHSPTPVPATPERTPMPTEEYRCIEVTVTGRSEFDGVYLMSNSELNEHKRWDLIGAADHGREIYWSNDSIFTGGYWVISSMVETTFAAFDDDIGEGYHSTPPLSDTLNWTISDLNSFDDADNHLVSLEVVKCSPQPGETWSPTSMPTVEHRCVEVTASNISDFNGVYKISNVTLNAHAYWELTGDVDYEGRIYWSNYSIFAGGHWIIRGSNENQIAAFKEDTGEGYDIIPPITGTWNWTVYNSPSFDDAVNHPINLKVVRCNPPIGRSWSPSPAPTAPYPTSLPTEDYHCIEVTIADVSGFDGVYLMSNMTLSEHATWYSSDDQNSQKQIRWINNDIFDGYWLILGAGEAQVAAFDDDTGIGHYSTPPLAGSSSWTIYNSGEYDDGVDHVGNLEKVRCDPFEGQTHSPTPLPTTSHPTSLPTAILTPSPTEEYHCIKVTVVDRPGFDGVYRISNFELNEHKHWDIIGPDDNGRMIYWSNDGNFVGGYWIISGSGETLIAAIDDDTGGGYYSIPPLTDTLEWTIYNSDSYNDGTTHLVNLEALRCSPSPGETWSPSPYPTFGPTDENRCVEVTTSGIPGFDGVYVLSNMTLNEHNYWDLTGYVNHDGRIYWSDFSIFFGGYWIISGSGQMQIAAFDDDSDEGYYYTPPLVGTRNWTVYNSSSFDDGVRHPINLEVVRCAIPPEYSWSPTPAPTTPYPTSLPTETYRCVEVAVAGVHGFDGVYTMSNITLNGRTFWEHLEDAERRIYWTDTTTFVGGYWVILGLGQVQVAAFNDDTGDGYYSTPPLTGTWNWIIYNSTTFNDGADHLVSLEPVRCLPSPGETYSPTQAPIITYPTLSPTKDYHCIGVNISGVSGLNGIYMMSNKTLNEHSYWYGVDELDMQSKVYWVNDSPFEGGYWIINGSGGMPIATLDDDTGEGYDSTPPLSGSWNWTVYHSNLLNDGIIHSATLKVLRCIPPNGQTYSPTQLPAAPDRTPRPTEEHHCIEVTVASRSGFDGIYLMSDVTLNDHKHWDLIGPEDEGRRIYWANYGIWSDGYWFISGWSQTLVAVFDTNPGDGYYSAPPLTDTWNWTVYNSEFFDDGESHLVNLEVVRCSPWPGETWAPTPYPTFSPTEVYHCVDVTINGVTGFDGAYIMSSMTRLSHVYWDYIGDGKAKQQIYWTNETGLDEGYWIISGAGENQIAAFDDHLGWDLHFETPPLNGSWNWTVYNTSSYDDGRSHPVIVRAIPCPQPGPCVDNDPFCGAMAATGYCYSSDSSIREMMLESCSVSCKSCSGSVQPTTSPTSYIPTPSPMFGVIPIPSIPTSLPTVDSHSCNNGSITNYSATGYTAYCCRENITNSSTGDIRTEITYAYIVISGQTAKEYVDDYSICSTAGAVVILVDLPEFGTIDLVWCPGISIICIGAALFAGALMFGGRPESVNNLLDVMADKANLGKSASSMTTSDIQTLAEHYSQMSETLKFEERQYESADDVDVPASAAGNSAFQVLKELFQDTSLNGRSSLDCFDFNRAISRIGIAPTKLVIDAVFERLDDGSGVVSVVTLFNAIEANIGELGPDADVAEVLEALNQAVLETFNRERRGSLSILNQFENARSGGGSVSMVNLGSVEGMINPETIRSLGGGGGAGSNIMSSHEFNKLLVSMGVPFSDSMVVERVMQLEALNPGGIDANEFQSMLNAECQGNSSEARSDAIARVLDNLINQHGGKEAADSAVAQHHTMEAQGACVSFSGNFAFGGQAMSSGNGGGMSAAAASGGGGGFSAASSGGGGGMSWAMSGPA